MLCLLSFFHSSFLLPLFFASFLSSFLLPLFFPSFTLLSFLLPFLTFAFHALVFPSGNAFSSFSLHLSTFLSIPLSLLSLTLHLSASLHFLSFFQYAPSSLSLYLD